MRTTIELPDQTFRLAKRLAAERGSTLRELVTQAVEHELAGRPASRKRMPLPRIRVPAHAPILTMGPAELAAAEEAADAEIARRVLRPGGGS